MRIPRVPTARPCCCMGPISARPSSSWSAIAPVIRSVASTKRWRTRADDRLLSPFDKRATRRPQGVSPGRRSAVHHGTTHPPTGPLVPTCAVCA
ncbi:hypothetical protein C8Q74DRAFT_847746 [Fomes fomentarius]|nr:hypothetical protein C8Q74DRAFT_847746 [Fomes fomentarius]